METDITRMLQAASGEGQMLSEELLPLVYDELRRLASVDMSREAPGQTLQPTALVHEAWLQLAGKDQWRWNDRAHFFRCAAQVMRRILVDNARRKLSLKRGARPRRLELGDAELAGASPDDCVLLVNEAMMRLEQEDPEAAQIVTLKYFGSLTNEEVAATLGTSERSVRRRWNFAKATLLRIIEEEL